MPDSHEGLPSLFSSDERRRIIESVLARRKLSASQKLDNFSSEDFPPGSLSPSQERMWFLHEMNPQNSAYNVGACFELAGKINLERLQKAIGSVCNRHEMLRSSFVVTDLAPRRKVLDKVVPQVRTQQIVPQQIESFLSKELAFPFDLCAPPLFRCVLAEFNANRYILAFVFHHIIVDGWSLGIFNRDFSDAYSNNGSLSSYGKSFDAIAIRQAKFLKSAHGNQAISYWENRLKNAPSLELPIAKARPAVTRFVGGRHEIELGEELAASLESVGRKLDATLYMVSAAAFSVLLHRYSGQEDIIFGTPVSGRTDPESEEVFGLFVNTLVLRLGVLPTLTLEEVVQLVKEEWLSALDHQSVPFEKVVERVSPLRALSHNPIFQVMFALQNLKVDSPVLPLVSVKSIDPPEINVRFDLECTLWRHEKGLKLRIVHNSEIIESPLASQFAQNYANMLRSFASSIERQVMFTQVTDDVERTKIAENERGAPLRSGETTLHSLFESAVAKAPNAIAIEDASGAFTFSQLNAKADSIAARLVAGGGQRGQAIGICLPRTKELAAAILGVLRSGNAFVPINPSDPVSRKRFVFDDAKVRCVITTREQRNDLPASIQFMDVEEASSQNTQQQTDLDVAPDSLAYILYTSGTTGHPKGAMVEHRNIASTLIACQRLFSFSPVDTGLVLASATFDVFLYELFSPMLAGGCSRLVDHQELFCPSEISELLSRATCIQAVPGLMEQLLESLRVSQIKQCPNLRLVMTGGDVVPPSLLGSLRGVFPNAKIVVTYGPTEAAIFCTAFVYKQEEPVTGHPIGMPIPGAIVRIGDEYANPLPRGVAGEIWIGGNGVCRGYLNREAETSKNFVDCDGERFYRSGDRARWALGGVIEFIGRNDRQVKVRGFRIELGEVESVLSATTGVRHVVAVAVGEKPSDRLLVCYVLFDDAYINQIEDLSLEKETVSRWNNLFDKTYDSRIRHLSGENDYTGWNSSFTDLPIPTEEMDEWVHSTLTSINLRIPAESRTNKGLEVLEIGCGTGLVLLNLAPHCKRCVGTDFSRRALADLREKMDRIGIEGIELIHASDDLSKVTGEFDVVVINSVSQYLPNEKYLTKLLDAALDRVRNGGFLFVGDVRSLPLQEAFRFSVEKHRRPGAIEELLSHARQRIVDEAELVVHPAYFKKFSDDHDDVSYCEVEPRFGRTGNEMSRYRFNAVLHKGTKPATKECKWVDWSANGWTLSMLRDCLKGQPESISFTNVPNSLILAEVLDFAEASKQTIGARLHCEAVMVDDIRDISHEYGFAVKFNCSGASGNGTFDMHIQKVELQNVVPNWPSSTSDKPFANNPLRRAAIRLGIKRIQDHAASRLPEYMCPSMILPIDNLPLTANGKVDRTAIEMLPVKPMSQNARPPRTAGERIAAEACSEVLGIELSVTDDFFDMGGTSLLAVQLSVRLRSKGARLNPQDVFRLRTLERIGEVLDKQQPEKEPKASELAPSRKATNSLTAPLLTPRRTKESWNGAGSVLLTGATGMLGIHLLDALIRESDVHVFCLVRGENHRAAVERLQEQFEWYFPGSSLAQERVTAIPGDMTLPRLGISDTDRKEIKNRCSHTIHAAADVRHVGNADEIHKANVYGTQLMLELTQPGTKFHHISTIGIAGIFTEATKTEVLTEVDLDIGQTTTEPYSESKFLAEKLMRSFFMRGGRGTVFRVGTIAPHSRTGQFQRDIDSHFLSRYLRSTIELGIACDWQDRYFSLTPVDILAQAILRFAIREDAVGRTFHLTNTQELSHGDLVKSLQSFGYRVQLLNSEEFENQLQILGTDQRKSEAVGRLLPLVERVQGKRVKIDKTWTDSWLEPLGISYPKFERDWFQKCLQNGICRGFFPPFP